ncbi:MAG: ECF transporter S component [Desulfocucumaceae bacterium]
MKVREIVWGGLLTSLALLIPLAFGGFLGVTIPPFSATIASHVPVMLAMTISPLVAFMVAAGSALGFFIKLGAVVGARASMHVVYALVGAYMIKRGFAFKTALIATLPLHAISEALIVIPFGFTLHKAGVVVGVGTAIHHGIDSIIALSLFALIGYMLPQGNSKRKKL